MALYKRKLIIQDDAVKAAVHLTFRQSVSPSALMTILFFLWGFGYGLLDTLNSHFQPTLRIDQPFLVVLSQICYVGARAAVARYFINSTRKLAEAPLQANSQASLYADVSFVPCIIFCIVAIVTMGTASVAAMIVLVLCAKSLRDHSHLALRGLGCHGSSRGMFNLQRARGFG
ncbi:l-fucose permease glucose galactose transporter protein [Penicillium chermesinum]|uniref:L-fucose permease glucose galactose transporter protein n=1 Tax=Penicillium chermesinum TaxID=63820 RepID=A0A9W9TSR7_9EURO|nr:l-fucose permease glucose galactose transporter protein [Penicillium chermesinum]KAJ5239812.1 l-fucose permease glucose galactose transporter protein [Penicillium chermesinum]KAJ6166690.1 l-fucose permease glucose galactose transporter protein [Penicillium chermesinum]